MDRGAVPAERAGLTRLRHRPTLAFSFLRHAGLTF
jgi:hypothetical protein